MIMSLYWSILMLAHLYLIWINLDKLVEDIMKSSPKSIMMYGSLYVDIGVVTSNILVVPKDSFLVLRAF